MISQVELVTLQEQMDICGTSYPKDDPTVGSFPCWVIWKCWIQFMFVSQLVIVNFQG